MFFFSFAVLFLIFILVYNLLPLPSDGEIIAWLVRLFEQYGIVIVLLGAFIEALFMLSVYLPGSAVLLLSVWILGNDIQSFIYIILLVVAGYMLAYAFNYFLGKYGYYRLLLLLGGKTALVTMQNNFQSHAKRTLALSGVHPNFFGIAVVVAGITRYGFGKVMWQALLINGAWTTLWVILAGSFFQVAQLESSGNSTAWIFLGLIVVWGIGQCVWVYVKSKKRVI